VDSGRVQDANDKKRERHVGEEDQPGLDQQISRAGRLRLLLAVASGHAGDRFCHPGGAIVHGLLLENISTAP
jgi:hypothetical protein